MIEVENLTKDYGTTVAVKDLSFRVDSLDALEAWRLHFDAIDVQHQALRQEEFGAVLIFRDPDRIQLELFVDPRA